MPISTPKSMPSTGSSESERVFYNEHGYSKNKSTGETFIFKPFRNHVVDFHTTHLQHYDPIKPQLNAAVGYQGFNDLYISESNLAKINADRVEGEETRSRMIDFPRLDGEHSIPDWLFNLPDEKRNFSTFSDHAFKYNGIIMGYATQKVHSDSSNAQIADIISRVKNGVLPFEDEPVYIKLNITTYKSIKDALDNVVLNEGLAGHYEIDWNDYALVFTRTVVERGKYKGQPSNSFNVRAIKMRNSDITGFPDYSKFDIPGDREGIISHWQRIFSLVNAPSGKTQKEETAHQIQNAVWFLGVTEFPEWAEEYEELVKLPEGVTLTYVPESTYNRAADNNEEDDE